MYNQELIKKVREGKAQVQVDKDDRWNDLLNEIFLERSYNSVPHMFYKEQGNLIYGYAADVVPFKDLPIIHASEFIEEVKWVEVSDDNVNWVKRIFIADLGCRFKFPIVVIDSGEEGDFLANGYKFMREIPEPETLTHEEIQKLIGKKFKYSEK